MNKIFYLSLLISFSSQLYAALNSGNKLNINQVDGVVEFQATSKSDTVLFYNEDGSIWKKIVLNTSYSELFKEIYPFSFNRNKRTLILKCLSSSNKFHKVVVDETLQLIKWVPNNTQWKYSNWKDHLLNRVVSIKFDLKSNPIKEKAKSSARNINIIGDIEPIIEIEKVKKDWMKITYYVFENEMTGWIKWKENNKLLISLIYSIRESNN